MNSPSRSRDQHTPRGAVISRRNVWSATRVRARRRAHSRSTDASHDSRPPPSTPLSDSVSGRQRPPLRKENAGYFQVRNVWSATRVRARRRAHSRSTDASHNSRPPPSTPLSDSVSGRQRPPLRKENAGYFQVSLPRKEERAFRWTIVAKQREGGLLALAAVARSWRCETRHPRRWLRPLAGHRDRDDVSMAYTPGVARVCVAIHEDPAKSWALTMPALLAGAPAPVSIFRLDLHGHRRDGARLRAARRRVSADRRTVRVRPPRVDGQLVVGLS